MDNNTVPLTPADLMLQIRKLISDRKVLAADSIAHAKSINTNRAERSRLSEEIKALVPQWTESKKAARVAAKPAPVEKAPKTKKSKPEAHVETSAA